MLQKNRNFLLSPVAGAVCTTNLIMARILLVEDAFDGAEAIARYLTTAGHTVKAVGNGKEALKEVLENTPDAVLLDLLMPDLDGPSFLEVVRAYLRLYTLPVVVLTGLPDSPLVARIRRLSVSAILVKGKAGPADICAALEAAMKSLPT